MQNTILTTALVLAGMMATPALADCVDDLRQWHNEKIEAQAIITGSPLGTSQEDMASVFGNGPDHNCKAYQIFDTAAKHEAAYYRQCIPGIEGEEKAYKADQGRVVFEKLLASGHCPVLREQTNTAAPSNSTQATTAPSNTALRIPKGVNCNRPEGSAEFVICQSAELADAEAQLEDAYRDAREIGGDRVRDEERAWVKRYMINCSVAGRERPAPSQMANATSCIMASVRQRTEELRRMAGN